ncbi:cell division protein FtsL [Acidimangrovimonas sediminis]|uniref:cell division protein FtsL n=1 Tax=Acidimangrovimonas sediminis TaxID=2056283 RepID=UPI0018ED14E1|nr:cell division protein FtsL [Acidimangrovimonas sediminis]
MKNLLYILTSLAVMALVFWAYRENYGTQHALKKVTALQHEIAGLKENLGMQRAEWAYLNRPARLRELALLNFERLKLVPMAPEQFGDVSQIPYPTPGEYDDKGADGVKTASADSKTTDLNDKDGQNP